ncbi:MAG TPA: hypothetical protein VIG90_11070 [Pedomonas sp.]|uniref:hypothetical protein n=1 Tax=Pedomonas sp. TaxID=2976421 RepID=UPI002F40C7B2
MEIEVGTYNEEQRNVPVTFRKDAVVHERHVNACHDENGAYDAAATAQRIEEVARGVANKIALGIITAAPAHS